MKLLCKKILSTNNISFERINKLASGSASIIYLVYGKKRFVIKIKLREGLGLDNEFYVLECIQKLNLGPKVFAKGIIEGKHYIIEEYLEGKILPWRFIKDKEVVAVAKFFKNLHSIPIDKKLKKLKSDNFNLIERLNYPKSFSKYSSQLARLIQLAESRLRDIRGKNKLVLRHTDPNPHNFIYRNHSIKAIDFEESQVGQRELDLADFIIKANLTKKQKELFLDTYGYEDIRIIDAYILTRTLSLCAWNIEQINKEKNGQLDKRLKFDRTRAEKVLKKRLNKLEKMLKIPFDAYFT